MLSCTPRIFAYLLLAPSARTARTASPPDSHSSYFPPRVPTRTQVRHRAPAHGVVGRVDVQASGAHGRDHRVRE